MSKFSSFTLTRKGVILMSKIIAGQKLIFTRCAIGDGELPYGTELCDLTTLIKEKMSLPITSVAIKTAGNAIVRTTFTNRNVTEDFYIRELGLFARETDGTEILYAIANAGDLADLLPAYGGAEIIEQIYDIIALVGESSEVTAIIDDSLIYATAQDLSDHAADPLAHPDHLNDPYAHSGLIALHLWRSGKAYVVGDICYSPYAASYKRFECVVAGTSGAIEPVWPAVGQMIADNTVKWIVDDVRDGTPVGRSVYEHRGTPRLGYIKKNGALLNRSEFPRLWAYAQNSGLLVSETEWWNNLMGCFSTGDGGTTFRIPDGRGDFERGWDDGRGADPGRVLGSWQNHQVGAHAHVIGYDLIDLAAATDGYLQGDIGAGNAAFKSTSTVGGNETRSRNIAELVCIKY